MTRIFIGAPALDITFTKPRSVVLLTEYAPIPCTEFRDNFFELHHTPDGITIMPTLCEKNNVTIPEKLLEKAQNLQIIAWSRISRYYKLSGAD